VNPSPSFELAFVIFTHSDFCEHVDTMTFCSITYEGKVKEISVVSCDDSRFVISDLTEETPDESGFVNLVERLEWTFKLWLWSVFE
jgi:hypothetical protein